MTAYTVGAKRRAKRGCMARAQQQIDRDEEVRTYERDDPQQTVMEARARRLAVKPTRDHLDAMLCDEAGQAIHIGAADKDEAKALWKIFTEYDGVESVYFRRIIGRDRFPAVSKMEYMPERLETRADDRPDLRTEDEKAQAANDAHAMWKKRLAKLTAYEQVAIHRASWHRDGLHKDGKLTLAGRAFMQALRALCRVVDESR